jgi:hypothetical protein
MEHRVDLRVGLLVARPDLLRQLLLESEQRLVVGDVVRLAYGHAYGDSGHSRDGRNRRNGRSGGDRCSCCLRRMCCRRSSWCTGDS